MTPQPPVALRITGSLLLSALLTVAAQAEERTPAATQAAAKSAPAVKKPLDLRPPDVTRLLSQEQLNRILYTSWREDIESVEVEGEREYYPSTPQVWPGLGAFAWAVMNPAQSWRIFAPLPPDQTRGMNEAHFDATADYLEPAGIPSPHAQ